MHASDSFFCIHVPQKFFDVAFDVLLGFLSGLALFSPQPARVQNVPSRPQAFVATGTRIMISKAVDQAVPQRGDLGNHQRLTERYPDVIHHEMAAPARRKKIRPAARPWPSRQYPRKVRQLSLRRDPCWWPACLPEY